MYLYNIYNQNNNLIHVDMAKRKAILFRGIFSNEFAIFKLALDECFAFGSNSAELAACREETQYFEA